ncbi:MAG: glycosyltransferase family 4 protein [Paracoccaceae bacterium]
MPDHQRLRIGYVLKRFPRLSETFVLNEILALERVGVEVEIFSLLKPPAEPRHGLISELRAPVTYLPSTGNLGRIRMLEGLDASATNLAELIEDRPARRGPLFPAKSGEEVAALHLKAAALAHLARQRGVSHLHAHFGSDATTVALLAGRLSGLGYSFTAHARDIYHTYDTPETDDAMRRIKIAEAAFVVTVSDYNIRHLRRLCPGAANRIHRIYNGIDLNRFVPNPAARQPGLIVAVGRMIEKKGFTDLIDACRLLAEGPQDFRCRIIGDGPMRDQLEAQIKSAGLSDIVELHEPVAQERLIGLLRQASVVVLPCVISASGDRDGLPTVLLEAMALAQPVVTTTVSGGPEIVEHGRNGLLAEPGDPKALAAMLEAIIADLEIGPRMGARGRARAERLFSLDRSAATLAKLFCESTGRARRELEMVN